jgi:hypothetical protein
MMWLRQMAQFSTTMSQDQSATAFHFLICGRASGVGRVGRREHKGSGGRMRFRNSKRDRGGLLRAAQRQRRTSKRGAEEDAAAEEDEEDAAAAVSAMASREERLGGGPVSRDLYRNAK